MKNYSKNKNGVFRTRVYTGSNAVGKPCYKSFTAHSAKELDDKVKAFKKDLLMGLEVHTANDSLGKWVELYLESLQKKVDREKMKQREYSMTKSRLDFFLQYSGGLLAKAPLKDIRTSHIEDVLFELYLKNPYTGNPTAKRTIARYRDALSAVFEFARRERAYVYPNPCSGAEIESKAKVTKRKAISPYMINLILASEHRAKIVVCIMLLAGLRRGEVAALTWFDINFEKKTITVNKSYDFKAFEVKEPKTEAGNRVVAMNDTLCELLLSAYEKYRRKPSKSALIIEKTTGGYMTEPSWKNLFDSYMKALNKEDEKRKVSSPVINTDETFEPFTAHQLRHTYVSLNQWAGVDIKTAQELAGHSDYNVTANIYTHASHDKKVEAANKQDEVLKKIAFGG